MSFRGSKNRKPQKLFTWHQSAETAAPSAVGTTLGTGTRCAEAKLLGSIVVGDVAHGAPGTSENHIYSKNRGAHQEGCSWD